jgi:hypothetical protein
MIKPAPPKSRGAAGVLFVWLLAFATAGLLIDVFVLPGEAASVLAGPGGRAMIGVAVAVGAAGIGFAMRFTLGRALKKDGDADARDHA